MEVASCWLLASIDRSAGGVLTARVYSACTQAGWTACAMVRCVVQAVESGRDTHT